MDLLPATYPTFTDMYHTFILKMTTSLLSLQFLLVLCKQVIIGFEMDHESAILNADSTLTF